MTVPQDLSRTQLIKVLCRDWGYREVHQEGSHVILQTETPGHQRLLVPNHNPLRVGTRNSIVRAVAAHKGVDRQTVLDSLRWLPAPELADRRKQ
jgi:predicted RNA binding protein YcfA (HicA-like mRNA interferase family)